jgi:hypothetical protein
MKIRSAPPAQLPDPHAGLVIAEDPPSAYSGGSARGYQEFFAPLAIPAHGRVGRGEAVWFMHHQRGREHPCLAAVRARHTDPWTSATEAAIHRDTAVPPGRAQPSAKIAPVLASAPCGGCRERMVTSLDSARLRGDHPGKAPAASQKPGPANRCEPRDIRHPGRPVPPRASRRAGLRSAGHRTSAVYDAAARVRACASSFGGPVALVAAVPIPNIPSGRPAAARCRQGPPAPGSAKGRGHDHSTHLASKAGEYWTACRKNCGPKAISAHCALTAAVAALHRRAPSRRGEATVAVCLGWSPGSPRRM